VSDPFEADEPSPNLKLWEKHIIDAEFSHPDGKQHFNAVKCVIEKFEISAVSTAEMCLIAGYLRDARNNEDVSVTKTRILHGLSHLHSERAQLLRRLTSSYQVERAERTNDPDVSPGRNLNRQGARFWFDLAFEEFLVGLYERFRPKPGRQISPLQGAAIRIYKRLKPHGVGPWDASRFIAEMLLEAGIEHPPVEKVRDRIHQKLRSIDLKNLDPDLF